MFAIEQAIIGKVSMNSVIALGQFDGVHKGHQALIAKAIKIAREEQCSSAALLFDPLPRAVLKQDFLPLQEHEARRALMLEYGLDLIHEVAVDRDFLSKSPEEFIIFLKKIQVKSVVVGSDFRFGYKRSGDLFMLAENFALEIVAEQLSGQRRISSTWCRELILKHDFKTFQTIVGRPWQVSIDILSGGRIETPNVLLPEGYFGDVVVISNGIYYNVLCDISSKKILSDLEVLGKAVMMINCS